MPGQKTIQKDNNANKPRLQKRKSQDQMERVKEKGIQIADTPGSIKQISSIKWHVTSQTLSGLVYMVMLSTIGLVCQCPANADGKMLCKHVFGIHKFINRQWWNRERKKIRIMRQNVSCTNTQCKSENIIKHGRRKCKRKSYVQRYMCKVCGCTFSGIDGFRCRHFPADTVVRALCLMASSASPTGVCRQLKMEGIMIHSDTVAKWAKHYSQIMSEYSSTLRVDAGYQWHVDELYFGMKKKSRYLFAIMDGESRFILSHYISQVKKGVDPTGLFLAAAFRSVRLPRILVSDGLQEFCKAAKKVFYRRFGPLFVHVREIHIQNIFNQNNIYERLNGEFRDRLYSTRGLKSDKPALVILLVVYHNFFRTHSSLKDNMTPAEAIGIDIVLVKNSQLSDECNKWITFIQNATLSINSWLRGSILTIHNCMHKVKLYVNCSSIPVSILECQAANISECTTSAIMSHCSQFCLD